MRRGLLLPISIAVVTLAGYGVLSAHLRSQDTTFSGYLSALMLNFWGGEQDQLIRVNLYTGSIAVYERGNLYKFAKVAGTGNPNDGTRTPVGQFRILSKEKRHVSRLSGVIMPLSMRFYEGYYFHDIPHTPGGVLITTKYSHGCIRLPTPLANEMFNWANVGAYVEIYSASLVRAEGSPTVYLLTEDGHKQPIASELAFNARGFQWNKVAVVPPAEVAAMPMGALIQ